MPCTPTTSCTMGIVRVGGAPETKCLWCDWGHLHRENPCSALTFLTLLHSCRITGRRTKTEMRTEKRARTQRTNSKSEENTQSGVSQKVDRDIFLCCWHDWEEFSHQLSYLPVKHYGSPYPSLSLYEHTERDFLPKAAQTKTLPDPQRDALNMPTTTG